jgi:hypothetical protein
MVNSRPICLLLLANCAPVVATILPVEGWDFVFWAAQGNNLH